MLFTWIILVLQILILFIFKGSSIDGVIASWIVILSTSISFFFSVTKRKLCKSDALILLGAWFVRILLLIIDLYCRDYIQLINSGADTELYHQMATSIANGTTVNRGGLYAQFVGVIYELTGFHREIAQFVNVMFGMQCILLLDSTILKQGYVYTIRKKVLLISCYMPNFIIINAILLKETTICFCVTAAIYLFIRWHKGASIFYVIFAIAISVLATAIHTGSIACFVGIIMCCAFVGKQRSPCVSNHSNVFVVILSILIFTFIYKYFYDVFFDKIGSIDSIEKIVEHSSSPTGGSGYVVQIIGGSSPLAFLMNSPVRILYFILAPLPWDWRNLNDVISFVFSGCFYGGTIVYAIRTMRRVNMENHALLTICIVIILTSVFVFAWGVSNAGTALRHRDKFMMIYLIVLADCMNLRIEKVLPRLLQNTNLKR